MSYGHYIKEIGRGAEGARDLTQEDAQQLYAALREMGAKDGDSIRLGEWEFDFVD